MKIHSYLWLLALALVIPKTYLVSLGGSGLRFEDLITTLALILFSLRGRSSTLWTPVFMQIYLGFIGIQVLSAIINSDASRFSSLLYPFRLLEFVIWFYIGSELALRLNEVIVRRYLFWLAIFFSTYSFGEYLGFFPKFGEFTNTDRVATSMSGPFEYAVVITSLGFFIKAPSAKIMSLLSLVLTEARVTLASTLLIYLFMRRGSAITIRKLFILPIIAVTLGFLINSTLTDRFRELDTSVSVVELARDYYNQVSPARTPLAYFAMTHQGGGQYTLTGLTDRSLELRLMRWSVILKTNLNDVKSIFIGKGPGYYGVAVDSYIVRCFGETGLSGILVFVAFLISFYRYFRSDENMMSVFYTLLACCLLIDIFVSMKAMILVWFLAGFYGRIKTLNSGLFLR